jgi:hypothetical protein
MQRLAGVYGAFVILAAGTGCAGASADEGRSMDLPFDLSDAPPAQFDGVLSRVGQRLSGSVIARLRPDQPSLPVVGSVVGPDIELTIGSDTAAFVFSGTIDDAGAPAGGLGATGILIGPNVGPVIEHISLLASGAASFSMR